MKKYSLFLLAIVLMTAGCAKAPQAEFSAAQIALSAAEEGEASVYAADMYRAAQESLMVAELEIETQNAVNMFGRDFSRAKRLIEFATTTSNEALASVETRKEEVRLEAVDLIAQVDSALTTMNELLATAPRGKDGALALVSIQEDGASVGQMVAEAQAALDSGEYAEAFDLARAALERVSGLNAELESATSRVRVLS